MSVTDVFPLIKAPEAWPVPVVATIAMVALAGLDLIGALFAKEWAENGSVRALVLGAGAFLVLFWVYASSLKYAELALVTMGWVVMLQVGPGPRRPLALRGRAAHRQVGRHRDRARRAGVSRAGADRRAGERRGGRRRLDFGPRTGVLRVAVGATCRRALSARSSPRSGLRTGRAHEGSPCVDVSSAPRWSRPSACSRWPPAPPARPARRRPPRPAARRRGPRPTAAPDHRRQARWSSARSSTTRRSTRPASSTAAGRC